MSKFGLLYVVALFSIGCGSPFEAASSTGQLRGLMDPVQETGTESQDDAGDPSSSNEASTPTKNPPPSPGDDAGDVGAADAALAPEASTGSEGGADACAPCDSTACESISGGTAAYDTCEATIYTCYATLDSECKGDTKGACQYTCTATEYSCQAACYTYSPGGLVGCIDTCATEATSCNGSC